MKPDAVAVLFSEHAQNYLQSESDLTKIAD